MPSVLILCICHSKALMSGGGLLCPQTQKIPGFHKVRDAGPAARNLEKDLPCVEGFAWKESTHSTKLTGKGKAPVFGFPEVSYEKKITGWYHTQSWDFFLSSSGSSMVCCIRIATDMGYWLCPLGGIPFVLGKWRNHPAIFSLSYIATDLWFMMMDTPSVFYCEGL